MKHFKTYWAFYVPYLIFFFTLLSLIVINEKGNLHLALNTCHTYAADVFFKYYTHVGGWVAAVVIAGLLFYNYRAALLILAGQVASGLVVHIAKRIWDAPRPKVFFQEHFPDVDLVQVLDVHMHSSHSFPSGHTASGFAMFLGLAYLTRRSSLHFLYFLLAVLVGYSRIYLSQHFAVDVLVASLISVIMTMLCKFYMDGKEMKWANGSLCAVFCRKKV